MESVRTFRSNRKVTCSSPTRAILSNAKQFETQTANGVGAELLEQGDLKKRFPSVNFDDVEIGVLTPDDAWIDPHAAMMGFRRMARHLGVEYRKDRVVDWQGDDAAARHVTLESRQTISADICSGGRGVVRRNRGDAGLACTDPADVATDAFLPMWGGN